MLLILVYPFPSVVTLICCAWELGALPGEDGDGEIANRGKSVAAYVAEKLGVLQPI